MSRRPEDIRVLIGCELAPGEDAAIVDEFPRYVVTTHGRIISLWGKSPRVLRPSADAKGYKCLGLRSDDGRRRSVRVHRLVACAFVPGRRNGYCVRHLDGNPANNAASNLAWGSYMENERDKIAHGTWETRRNGKLSERDRAAIRARLAQGVRHATLAADFGVSRPTITRLSNGKIWGCDEQ